MVFPVVVGAATSRSQQQKIDLRGDLTCLLAQIFDDASQLAKRAVVDRF